MKRLPNRTACRYGDAFHELHRLGNIAVALPVSTTSRKRSFSVLRHIKTLVRNSMLNGRLSNVAVLAEERERTMSISNKKIIDTFAAVFLFMHQLYCSIFLCSLCFSHFVILET